jgi:hypothetical protein
VVALEGRERPASALDLQRRYLDEARRFLDQRGATPQQDAVWSIWQETLAKLDNDWRSLGREVDWVIKYQLLESQIDKRSLSWDSPVVKEMDIKYHGVVPDSSIYHLLLRSNLIDRVVSDEEVKERLVNPPPDTRAALRSQLLSVLDSMLVMVNWACVTVFDADNTQLVRLRLLVPTNNGAGLRDALLRSEDVLATAAEWCSVERFMLGKTKNDPKETTRVSQAT